MTKFKFKSIVVFTTLLFGSFPALTQTAPPLGEAASFSVLGSATVTNTGPTVVTGDLGVSPGTAVTGFPPGTLVGGSIHAADALAAQAQIDAATAYNNLAAQACTTTYLPVTDLGGMTLLPGVHCFPSSAAVTGTLTLNAQGNSNAVFVFKTGSTFITASGASVSVINGGQNCNVFWQVGSSATLGTTSTVPGTIIALASITLNTGARVSGRAIARTAAVTLDSNNVGGCAAAPPPPPPPAPAPTATAPPLGVLQQFSVLGNSGVTSSTGVGTVVNGDVGSSPTASMANFPPSRVTPPFILHLGNDLTVLQAHADAIAAYNSLAAQGPGMVLPAQLNGAVLTSGLYSFAGGAADLGATGTLTLNGPGIFVFQVASTITANVGSNVIGTANPCDVFWRVGTSATLNGISFRGNVIADASITVGSGSNVTGRAITGTGPTGAVTMAGAGGNTIGGCASPGVVPPIAVVSGSGSGLFPPNTTFDGVPITGLQFGFGLDILDAGSAVGQLYTVLLGIPVDGVQQRIVIEGIVSSASRTAANAVNFSGNVTVNGAGPIPFTAAVVTDANDQGTLGLVIGGTTLPNAGVNEGSTTIK